ncbi:cytochrome ubiquinol oxidase subunit I [Amnibacterium kyonggiense]|uniref:Cytochrome bd-I ubiquinol oxidase subunit 1 apoprotein n=1 Tax=Amnibacterium kyonggiense TaxID=595671 RepID=A0A4R7FKI6_9MICO|nr:cytochrome ubiquinol oxidase subunit I [Amnibacterium kyonggiense]TDS76858.1 cytochrome bd-I ubiquinol oxidase subunit 1 apoprotein [Amnibacterium kyonggiense]
MDPLDIARWQFGITTVYHFLMVPLTLGLGPVVGFLQWRWVRTADERWLRLTKFFGKLYLVNFIVGVATGIVQEFQFGMAWSEYSRYVGDVFGAPLAMEGLFAFFFESTFLGLWIFGWGRLPKRIHLATLWIAVLGSIVSAFFIIVANSWMQHPVGVRLVDGRPRLVDIWAVLTNSTALAAYAHTITGAFAVAGGFLLGIAWYQLWRRRHDGIDVVRADRTLHIGSDPDDAGRDVADHAVWIRALRIGAVVAIVGFAGVAVTGDLQGKLLFQQQPMKMAVAEAACETGTGFSVLSIGDVGSTDCTGVTAVIEIPGLLSFLANGDTTTTVEGVKDLLPAYQAEYGRTLPKGPLYGARSGRPVDYVPDMQVTYWGFRIMIGFGGVAAFAAAVALWLTRRGTVPASRWLARLAVLGILAPFGANAAGWIFTELGRQPFVVAPNPTPGGVDGVFMFTAAAVSPGVTSGELLFSLIGLALVYAVLLVVEVVLLVRYVRGGVAAAMPELRREPAHDEDDDVLAFAY